MREKSHPRRKLICEARQDGHSQTQQFKRSPQTRGRNSAQCSLGHMGFVCNLKEVPRPGDENRGGCHFTFASSKAI